MVLPATIELCLLAFSLSLLVGIPLGITTGVLQHKTADRLISGAGVAGLFAAGVLAGVADDVILFAASGLAAGVRPFRPALPGAAGHRLRADRRLAVRFAYRDEMIASAVQHLILPVLVLSVGPTTEVIRLMRISTTDVGTQNYIKAAIIRGLPRSTVIRRHLLHNALPPIIPQLGLQFSTMLTLEMITEVVFNWPGIGRWLVNAIRQQDFAAISAGVMVIGALVITINMLSDIWGAMANPLKHKEWYALR
ncbi:peptide ABC transporter permease [Pseudomonas syringae pv. actinidiae]|nr:peptide ABC transporter permease [Pseudomonas syringae pv. actinidiae]